MFGVIRIDDRQMMNSSQNHMVFHQGTGDFFNQSTNVQPVIPQQTFYQVQSNGGFETNCGSPFDGAGYVQTKYVVSRNNAFASCQNAKRQAEEWRNFLKELCDAEAKQTEQTAPFMSMIFGGIGFRLADNPIEAAHKAASVLQKWSRIFGNAGA